MTVSRLIIVLSYVGYREMFFPIVELGNILIHFSVDIYLTAWQGNCFRRLPEIFIWNRRTRRFSGT